MLRVFWFNIFNKQNSKNEFVLNEISKLEEQIYESKNKLTYRIKLHNKCLQKLRTVKDHLEELKNEII